MPDPIPKKFFPPDLREADPQVQRGAEREPRRTLHAARRGSSDGRSNAGWQEREVKPHVPDARIDINKRDEKDGKIGIMGYEINFKRYFYRQTPPRPLEEIEADIRVIEQDIVRMLREVTE